MRKTITRNQTLLFIAFILLGINANLKGETVVPIGAGSTYKTIQTAYDAIKDAAVLTPITGAYVLELQGDYDPTQGTTLETFPITLNAINGASVENTITIRPKTGVKVTLSYPNQTVVATNVSCATNSSATIDITLTTVSNDVSVLSTSSYVAGQGTPNNPFKQLAGVNAATKTLTLATGTITSTRTSATLFFGPQQTKTINFDGAKYVIIDGVSRTDASTGLTISNPNCIYSQTIYFMNNAQYNTIRNCIIRGANQTGTSAGASMGGTIFFNGGSYNTITQNDVCDLSQNLISNDGITPMPVCAFQLAGKHVNSSINGDDYDNTISQNNIYNIENLWATPASYGFFTISSGDALSKNNKILNNKMFWTRDAYFATGTTITPVGTSSSSAGVNNQFEGNTIGYKTAEGTGTAILYATGATFKGFSGLKNYTCTNNKIANITMTGASFTGIEFGTSNTSTSADNYCSGNTIENINLTLTAAGALTGIIINASNNNDSNIKNNIVRNLTAESATPSFACTVVGINVTGTANTNKYNYTSNQIYNLTAGKSTSTAANVATGLTIGGNAITVEKNIIYNIATLNSTALAPSIVTGIQTTGGNNISGTSGTVVKNNIVRLGTDFSNDATIYGINQGTVSATTNKAYFYNNSIYIGGTSPAASSQNSFAFYTATATIPTNNDIENNIFDNQRTSSSGIAKHYALGYGTAGAIKLSDYNLYFATPLGLAVNADKTSLTNFAYTASDAHSLTGTPGFNNPTATTPDLTCNPTISTVDGVGLNLAATTPAVTDDYIGTSRGTSNDIGAYNYTSSGPSPVTASISSSGSPTTDNPISLTIQFNASVTGFDITDLVVRNGVASNFSGSGTTYTVNIIPTGAAISVDVPAGVVVDGSGNANSQASQWSVAYNSVTVTATLGITSANYPTVKAAFDAINAGTHKGAINIALYTSTSESASAVLNASGSGSASYTSVNIYPMASNLVIAGNFAAPLIDLNGADNVTINGSVNQANNAKSLSIINYSNSATAGTSTIRLYNDAKSNTIKYCTIKGSTMDATGGVIFVSTGPTDGNDNNIITYNDITNAADVNRPLAAINSTGGVTPINDNLEISNNNIFDFFNRGTASYGVYLGANTSAAKIKDNSFYETNTFIPTAAVAYNVIYITNTSGINFEVSNNYIGGQAANCGGNAWTKTNANNNLFSGMYLSVGTSTASSIQNNTIKNFAYANNGTSSWTGINVAAGNVNIGTVTQNTIGASTGNTSILYTSSVNGNFYGIYSASAGTVTCKNNLIGGITSTTSAGMIQCVYYNAAGTLDCQNNTITSILTVGNTAATSSHFKGVYVATTTATAIISSNTISNINASSTSTGAAQSVIGIQTQQATTLTISGNTLYNITNSVNNSTTTGSNLFGIYSAAIATQSITGNTIHDLTIGLTLSTDNSIYGIGVTSTSATGSTVTGNTIYGISSNNSSFAGPVTGIFYSGKSSGTNSVARNFIYGLSVHTSTTAASLYGIKIATGATTYANNMINLGGNTQSVLYGIYETGAANNNNSLYHNSVYIGGTPSATANSYALYSAGVANVRDFRNNILVNARSTNGTHYAAYITAPSTGTLTNNYNLYYASGTGGMLGYYSGDKSALPIVPNPNDANSINANPNFIDPTNASTPDLRIIGNTTTVNAVSGASALVTDDYYGITRNALTPNDLGAYAYTPTGGTGPTVTISSTAGSYTKTSPIPVTITFSSPVIGFVVSDLILGNCTASNFAGSGTTYTVNITPTAQGAVTVDIAAAVAADASLNGNIAATQFVRIYDNIAPTVSITSTALSPTNVSPIPVTITFSEAVTGFVVGGLTLGNCTASNFAGSGTTYTVDITPTASSVTVGIAAGVAQDAATNGNTAATQFSRTYDNVTPTVSITSTAVSPTNVSPIPVTITFSEVVTGFVVGDLTLGNCTASNFAGGGTTYTVDITPTASSVTVDIAAGVAQDAANNVNTAATQFSETYTAYYRSAASGNWGTAATWESSVDNSSWATASSAPTSAAASVIIQNGHLVTISADATAPALTVNGGGQLTLNDAVTLTVSGDFTIKSDPTNGTGTFVDYKTSTGGLTVTGTTTVQQWLTGKTGTSTRAISYLSSPVSAATAAVFDVAAGINKMTRYDETVPGYVTNFTSNTTALTPGVGYVAYIGGADAAYSFTGGSLNTGTITIPVTRTGTTAGKRGFNLVGNPYPSYLDWKHASNTKTNLRSTIWYRTSVGSGATMTFDTYDGSTGTNNNNKGAVTQYIPPMQAFWVKVNADGDNAVLSFTNAARSNTDVSVPTNKLRAPAQKASEAQIVRLRVSNGTNSDETILVADANATDALDTYDSEKMSNENAAIPEIYTLAGSQELVINHLTDFAANKQVKLGFRPGANNNFSIVANEISNVDVQTKVVLIDKWQNNAEFDLTDGAAYTFSSAAAPTADRFVIAFKAPAVATNLINTNNINMFVYSNANNQITVNRTTAAEAKVTVCNAIGQKLVSTVINGTKAVIQQSFGSGVYFVTVITAGNKSTQKVIIN